MTRYDVLLGRNNLIITHAGFNNQAKIKADVSLNGGHLVTLVSEFSESSYKFYDIEKLLPGSVIEMPSFVNHVEVYPEAVQFITFRFYQGQLESTEDYPILLGAGLGKRKQNLGWITTPVAKFLTHQPVNKKTTIQDEEFLYFLNNFEETIDTLCVRMSCFLDDNTQHFFDAILIENPEKYLYCFDVSSVSVNRLFFAAFEGNEAVAGKTIKAYRVQVCKRDTGTGEDPYDYTNLSQIRYYEIVNNSGKDIFLTFRNSFGVFDTLRLVGSQKQSQVVDQSIFETDEGVELSEAGFFRKIVVNAGEFEQNWLEYMQELVISREIYLRTRQGPQRLLCTTKELPYRDDTKIMDEAQFEFRYVENETNFAQ